MIQIITYESKSFNVNIEVKPTCEINLGNNTYEWKPLKITGDIENLFKDKPLNFTFEKINDDGFVIEKYTIANIKSYNKIGNLIILEFESAILEF